jgi:dipeptidyl aminopeptidase/acylaminoacyl peptidase
VRTWQTASALLAAALSAGVLGSAHPADAAFPGVNGRIVFSGTADGRAGLFTVAADGSDLRRLTEGSDGQPAWSHDGSRIAFSRRVPSGQRYPEFERELFVMNADGSGITRVTNRIGGNYDPSWAPDGRRLVFTFGSTGLDVTDVGGGPIVDLVCYSPGSAYRPAWSPDGRWVVASYAANGLAGLYLIDPVGRGGTWLTSQPADSAPAWRPDGQRLAFTRGGGISQIDVDGGNLTKLTTPPQGMWDDSPAWSPDGRKLVFTRFEPGASLHILDIATGVVTRVPGTAGASSPDWQAQDTGHTPAASAPPLPPCAVPPPPPAPRLQSTRAVDVLAPNRLLVAKIGVSRTVLRTRKPFDVSLRIDDAKGSPVSGALVKLEAAPGWWGRVVAPRTAVPTDSAGLVTITLRPTRQLALRPGRRLVLVARARTPDGTFVGGTSARRLLSVRVSSP